jgi:hypothetical protein
LNTGTDADGEDDAVDDVAPDADALPSATTKPPFVLGFTVEVPAKVVVPVPATTGPGAPPGTEKPLSQLLAVSYAIIGGTET